MKHKETIREFYANHGQEYPQMDQFNVYRREEFLCANTSLLPNRRDFYKISLVVQGEGILTTADKAIRIQDNALLFMNPLIPYSWEASSVNQTGIFCLFTEDFVTPILKGNPLSQSQLFKVGGDHIFFPDKESMRLLKGFFENMFLEVKSSYLHKNDLLRTYVQIIMHEAMKMQPPKTFFEPANASKRVSNLFLELLERQFPIDSPNQTIKLKNANEFASQLNIHTNTLNRALREATGKTTTEWIAERTTMEAKALLQYSNWDIAEIAYSLGFEHSSNFIIFFKKQTGKSPLQFRKDSNAIS
ncbi:helix-turn-helix domain-containing protein [Thermoflexibacter ruber]|uniref:AraC-like ligand binding domain-containing protein n=1 Tax=Thermoflexibacter ruber TaxID=1003 RepID=A0A1I2GDG5_9BACT|nr:AraC family transcriptional regulator [Thermoflexibacter ruber]SFF14786.1 AraC-like ligand binding domain-containing protein [Thermoflexibacter ruber]